MRYILLILLHFLVPQAWAQHPGALLGTAHAFPEDPYASSVATKLDSLLLIANATFSSELEGQSKYYAFTNTALRDIPDAPYTAASLVISVGVEVIPVGKYDFAADERFSSLYVLPHGDPYEDALMLYRKIMEVIADEKEYWELTQR